MHKEFEELAKQAGFYLSDGECFTPIREDYDMGGVLEKFAELIVRECIRMHKELDDSVVLYELGQGIEITTEQFVLRHFGLAE